MIQPFLGDLFSCTVFHRFFNKITGNIGKQSVNPDADFVFVLCFKLPLSVDRPTHQPFGVHTADDASGHYFSGAGITFADVGDIRNDLFIQRGDRCRFPVCFGDIGAELFRVSE